MNILKKNKNRVLSVFSLVMINIIAIDSLRNVPTNAKAGLSIAFFYILAAILFMLPSALVSAELATHHPKTGGAYVWVREAFGVRFGFLSIWLQWIYNVVWYPTILSFIAVNIAYLINPSLASNKMYIIAMIVLMFSIATVVNFFGMKVSSYMSTISAILGTMLPMLMIIILGFIWISENKSLAIVLNTKNFLPSFGHMEHFSFLVIVLFSLMGLEMSGVHAEEVKNPKKDYPKALLYSSVLIILTLILSSLAIAIVIPQSQLNILSGLDQAFHLFLNAFGMQWLQPIVILCIILGGFGGMAAWVIGPTKGMMIAAKDGCMPSFMGVTTQKKVPVTILLMQWCVVLLLCILFVFFKFISTSYWILSDLTAQLALLFYVLFFAAAIKLRYKTAYDPKAFRIPGGKIGIWMVAGLGILACLAAFFLGFLPPDGIVVGRVGVYQAILIIGILIFSLPPLLMSLFIRKKK